MPQILEQKRFGRQLLGFSIILITTLFWGSTFVVTKSALDSIQPPAMVLIRFLLAALCLTPFIRPHAALIRPGLELGFYQVFGIGTQTIGLQFTTVNRSAFITSLYVIFLPLLMRSLGYRLNRLTWVAAIIALAGVGLLSYDGSPPNVGDGWTLLTAACYTMFIWRVEHFVTQLPVMALSAAQLWGAASWALLWVLGWMALGGETIDGAFFQGRGDASALSSLPWREILYLGLIATAITTWGQTVGQKFVNAAQASVLFTLEPVWASFFAFLILDERLSLQGFAGAAAILAATLISQFSTLLTRSDGSLK